MSIEKSKWERCLKASPVVSVRNWCQASIPNAHEDRKSTRLNSSHDQISYAVFCLKKKIDFEVDVGLELRLDVTGAADACGHRAPDDRVQVQHTRGVLARHKHVAVDQLAENQGNDG